MTKIRLSEIQVMLEEYDHHKLWMPLVEEIINAALELDRDADDLEFGSSEYRWRNRAKAAEAEVRRLRAVLKTKRHVHRRSTDK